MPNITMEDNSEVRKDLEDQWATLSEKRDAVYKPLEMTLAQSTGSRRALFVDGEK